MMLLFGKSPLPIKHRTHSYEMPTARLSVQAQDDPLITPYMVMGLVSQVRGRRINHSVYRPRERERGRERRRGREAQRAERERE